MSDVLSPKLLGRVRGRPFEFTLPSIESVSDISAAMQAVTGALARDDITPGEAATIAGVVETLLGRSKQPPGEVLL